jgi:hypothetical protein
MPLKGDVSKILPGDDVDRKARAIEESVPSILSTVTRCKFHFIGARQLVDIDRLPPQYTDTLKCSETITLGKTAYISLVELAEYNRFYYGRRKSGS